MHLCNGDDEIPDLVPYNLGNYIGGYVDEYDEDSEIPDLVPRNSHVIPNYVGPFGFNKSVTLDIKPDPTYEELFNVLNEYPFTYINFCISSNKHMSYGNGASRQIYQLGMTDLINKLLQITHGYFLGIDAENNLNLTFWDYEDNIELFVSLIGLNIASGCILPYHLHPILLQKIVQRKMDVSQQLHFLKYYSPDLYVEINKHISNNSFDVEAVTGYNSLEEYIETNIFMNKIDDWKLTLYEKIADACIKNSN